jgi:hypothetical protein
VPWGEPPADDDEPRDEIEVYSAPMKRLLALPPFVLAFLACTSSDPTNDELLRRPSGRTATDAGDREDGAVGPVGPAVDAAAPRDGGDVDARDSSTARPCDGVTCSGHGTCSEADAGAACVCEKGYHAIGLECVLDETCGGVDCGRCGTCKVVQGVATCTCPNGYKQQNGKCVLSPDPCTTAKCGPGTACVSEAHCSPLGACVPTCDCSNCGNCGPSSDGRWNDMQEYCGNLNSSPATKACNKPCPAGQGCLPYATPICWPIEGCFSL